MKTVLYTFREHAPEENHDRLRDEISRLPGVQGVGRIKPDATKPALRRMWYADVIDDAAASALVAHLRQEDDIQSANLPAERGLP